MKYFLLLLILLTSVATAPVLARADVHFSSPDLNVDVKTAWIGTMDRTRQIEWAVSSPTCLNCKLRFDLVFVLQATTQCADSMVASAQVIDLVNGRGASLDSLGAVHRTYYLNPRLCSDTSHCESIPNLAIYADQSDNSILLSSLSDLKTQEGIDCTISSGKLSCRDEAGDDLGPQSGPAIACH